MTSHCQHAVYNPPVSKWFRAVSQITRLWSVFICNHWLVDILQTRAVKKMYRIRTFSTSHMNWWTRTWWVTFLGERNVLVADQKQIWSQMLIHQETLSPASFGMNRFLLKWLRFKSYFMRIPDWARGDLKLFLWFHVRESHFELENDRKCSGV